MLPEIIEESQQGQQMMLGKSESLLWLLVSLTKEFRNRLKCKLEGNLLEFRGKASGQASCPSQSFLVEEKREDNGRRVSHTAATWWGRENLKLEQGSPPGALGNLKACLG